MTSTDSDRTIEDLTAVFLKHQDLEIEAMEREDVEAANRHFGRIYEAVTELARSAHGRQALEALMQHEKAEIRQRAAFAGRSIN
jgi:hypothetical protein